MAGSTDGVRARAAATRANGGPPRNGVARRGPLDHILGEIRKLSDQFEAAIPTSLGLTPDRFVRIATTTIRQSDDLQQVAPATILGALMSSAQLGLEPGGALQQAYLVPFKGQCVLVIGYRGYVTLARRSGEISSVVARTVYQREDETGRFDVEYGLADTIHHKPIIVGERGPEVAYYATAKYHGGGHSMLAASRDDIERIRKSAPSQNSPAWRNWYDRMAWAKVVKMLARWMPLSTELGQAVAADETVRSELALDAIDESKVVEVDQETGEVKPAPAPQQQAPPAAEPGYPVEDPPGWADGEPQ